jgi:hypothetical protein
MHTKTPVACAGVGLPTTKNHPLKAHYPALPNVAVRRCLVNCNTTVAVRLGLYRSYLKYLVHPWTKRYLAGTRPFKWLGKTLQMQEILSVKYQDTIMYTFGF